MLIILQSTVFPQFVHNTYLGHEVLKGKITPTDKFVLLHIKAPLRSSSPESFS